MVQLDFTSREVTIKLVYSGPALSGKTTNLQQIHRAVQQEQRTELMSLDTHGDRTLFFDLLPLTVKTAGGLTVRLKVYTVPGQVHYNATRRIVLAGADGVVFVADSQLASMDANNESYQNLCENLQANGIEITQLPIVVQFNKQDLPDVCSGDQLAALAAKWDEPVFTSVAKAGTGVLETFVTLLEMTWDDLAQRCSGSADLGLGSAEFRRELAQSLGLGGDFDPAAGRIVVRAADAEQQAADQK